MNFKHIEHNYGWDQYFMNIKMVIYLYIVYILKTSHILEKIIIFLMRNKINKHKNLTLRVPQTDYIHSKKCV